MTIPVFILAGQSNASTLSNEIETALDERYGAGNYEFLSVSASGAPLTREREDEPDWADPTELSEELTTGLIDVLNEDPDHVIGGIIWVHGEADTYYAGGAAGYGEDLEDLIDDLRSDVSDAMGDRETGLDVAPVTILELSENAPAAPDREAWDRVIFEQREVAEADPLVTTLDPDTVAEDADVSEEAMFQDNLHYAGDFQYLLAEELVETMNPPILFGIIGEDEPIEDPDSPVDDPVEPVVDPVIPVDDPVEPVVDPVIPVDDPVEPVVNPIIPVVDPVEQDTDEDVDPADEFDDGTGIGDLAWLFVFLPILGLLG